MAKSKSTKRRRTAKSDKRAAEHAENIKLALDYRRRGYDYHEIAESMSVSPRTVSRWITEAIKDIPREEATAVRAVMLKRLDEMLKSPMRAVDEDCADSSHISSILAIEDRRAKLLGIYDIWADGDAEDPNTRAGRMLGAAIAQMQADAPVLRPDAAIPLVPIL
jgi:Homeodomain-like domain